jgi:hypothetical protein
MTLRENSTGKKLNFYAIWIMTKHFLSTWKKVFRKFACKKE